MTSDRKPDPLHERISALPDMPPPARFGMGKQPVPPKKTDPLLGGVLGPAPGNATPTVPPLPMGSAIKTRPDAPRAIQLTALRQPQTRHGLASVLGPSTEV